MQLFFIKVLVHFDQVEIINIELAGYLFKPSITIKGYAILKYLLIINLYPFIKSINTLSAFFN